MKATEQYFAVMLFRMHVVLTFESVNEILKCNIQMKATEQYFAVMLFMMLYLVVPTLRPVECNVSYGLLITRRLKFFIHNYDGSNKTVKQD